VGYGGGYIRSGGAPRSTAAGASTGGMQPTTAAWGPEFGAASPAIGARTALTETALTGQLHVGEQVRFTAALISSTDLSVGVGVSPPIFGPIWEARAGAHVQVSEIALSSTDGHIGARVDGRFSVEPNTPARVGLRPALSALAVSSTDLLVGSRVALSAVSAAVNPIRAGARVSGELVAKFITPGTHSFVAPTTAVTAECWGGGGGGGGADTLGGQNGGGGGGGAYALKVMTGLTVGNSYTVTVGSGGGGNTGTGNGIAGGDSWFQSSTRVLAKGGSGGAGHASGGVGGPGGSTAASIGDTRFKGGNGSNDSVGGSNQGGGGGGGAGDAAAGSNSGGTAGAAGGSSGGGAGGNGGVGGNASGGTQPGGGGGGGGVIGGNGASGGHGQVWISRVI
jgi:hypothetical protein